MCQTFFSPINITILALKTCLNLAAIITPWQQNGSWQQISVKFQYQISWKSVQRFSRRYMRTDMAKVATSLRTSLKRGEPVCHRLWAGQTLFECPSHSRWWKANTDASVLGWVRTSSALSKLLAELCAQSSGLWPPRDCRVQINLARCVVGELCRARFLMGRDEKWFSSSCLSGMERLMDRACQFKATTLCSDREARAGKGLKTEGKSLSLQKDLRFGLLCHEGSLLAPETRLLSRPVWTQWWRSATTNFRTRSVVFVGTLYTKPAIHVSCCLFIVCFRELPTGFLKDWFTSLRPEKEKPAEQSWS